MPVLSIEKTFPPSSTHDYVRGIVKLAATELAIPMPEIVYFKNATYTTEVWQQMEVGEGDGVGGFAEREHHRIALRFDRNLDTLLHVTLHEVKHLAQGGITGPLAERDACDWADSFVARRFPEVYALLNQSGADGSAFQGYRDHDCTYCAMAAVGR